ncbi:RpiB/LacA/LacB family sugar-phosphate isomerase [Candidatus Uhrbacteria bacterium]|nr:RpiB/LacA/LacB family sugar-phosphate isomerase [Candidatus Uhrbacteria bacterium]MBD3284172.1 RpiB/LacA/LacB family sugar-phosphate isomerase [Candidatus Uhrbacteria bacterium]
MKPILLGADHAGFKLKERIKEELERRKIPFQDLSPTFKEGDDYPRIGMRIARKLKQLGGHAVLVCGSGVGMAIAANRIKGVRAVLGHNAKEVERARIDDDVNLLALSGWKTSMPMAMGMITKLLKTKASSAARHRRRVKQLG